MEIYAHVLSRTIVLKAETHLARYTKNDMHLTIKYFRGEKEMSYLIVIGAAIIATAFCLEVLPKWMKQYAKRKVDNFQKEVVYVKDIDKE